MFYISNLKRHWSTLFFIYFRKDYHDCWLTPPKGYNAIVIWFIAQVKESDEYTYDKQTIIERFSLICYCFFIGQIISESSLNLVF